MTRPLSTPSPDMGSEALILTFDNCVGATSSKSQAAQKVFTYVANESNAQSWKAFARLCPRGWHLVTCTPDMARDSPGSKS